MIVGKLNIEYLDPKSLFRNPWNSNSCDPKAERQLDKSLSRHGAFDPVKVRQLPNGNLEILGGQHRTESAIRLKMDAIPVINLGEVDEQRAREISLIDNGRYGQDDSIKLLEVIESINENGDVDLDSFLPYDALALDAAMASRKIDFGALGDEDPVDLDDDSLPGDELVRPPPLKTHTTMRFSVTLEDADAISEIIKQTIESNKIVDGGSLQQAGDALSILVLGE